MPIINITVREKIAHTIGNPHIVCGNSDYVVHFDFDAEWDAYETKTARYIWGGKYTDVLFEGTECPVPVIMDAYGVLVGVYAGKLHTTTAAAIDTDKSILSGDGLPADPLPDVYAQIIAKLADAKTLSGDGVPTTETEGAVGQMYYDKTGKRLYVCTDTTSGYTWQAIEAEAAVDVDDTLTKAGKAADAKAVGDKIDEVDEKVAGKLGEKELAGAIDTALAQAKESGAFDGEKGEPGADGHPGADGQDGVTPHIGQNGNWWIGTTDTGVSAAGSSDKSLGITSATIGQIVRIDAVDANGKPTAWEAVDMPSGGDSGGLRNIDLIVDHTVTAEEVTVARLTWDTTTIPELGKYNLFYAVISSQTKFSFTKWVKFRINNGDVAQFNGTSSPEVERLPISVNRYFGRWVGTHAYKPINSSIFPLIAGVGEMNLNEAANNTNVDANSIGIGSYSADFGLTEGMSIKIYAMV